MTTIDTLTITRPDDWHLHLRDGELLNLVAPHTAAVFRRAIVMPNLKPPVTTAAMAMDYQARIKAAAGNPDFAPLMTIYLTDETTPEVVREAKAAGVVAAKLYPAGATTNSAAGVTDITKLDDTFAAMADAGMLLLLHGEVTGNADIFDREALYLEQVLKPLLRDFPTLKIVLEHITTHEAADAVREGPDNLACTITPQHLLYNRNAIFTGGINPHYFCLPILKRETHREALLSLAISEHPRVFLGTDSAPHRQHDKESACGCAGCYSGLHAMPLYAEVFEQANALHRLEAFTSHNGADFYGLPRNPDTITLIRQPWVIPETIGDQQDNIIVPLDAGKTLQWQVQQ